MGEHLFYIRISDAKSQNTARQDEVFDKGFFDKETNTIRPYDRKFTDKVSGRSLERPALQEMLSYARSGDHIYTTELSRLGRNTKELHQLVEQLRKDNIAISFIKENLTVDGKGNAVSDLIFTMLGAISQFEVDLTRERREEGRRIAVAEGRAVQKIKSEDRPLILVEKEAGTPARELAEKYGVSHTQILRICREEKLKREKALENDISPFGAPDLGAPDMM